MKPVPLVLHVQPSRPGEAPPEIRLRQALKLMLRGFSIRAEWAPSLCESHSEPARPVNFTDSPDPICKRLSDTAPFDCFSADNAPPVPETPTASPATPGVPQAPRRTLTKPDFSPATAGEEPR